MLICASSSSLTQVCVYVRMYLCKYVYARTPTERERGRERERETDKHTHTHTHTANPQTLIPDLYNANANPHQTLT